MSTAREQVESMGAQILSKDFETLHREWLTSLKAQGYPADTLAGLADLRTIHLYWFTEGKRHGSAEVALLTHETFRNSE